MSRDKLEIGARWSWIAVRGNDGRLPAVLWQHAHHENWRELLLRGRRRGEWLSLAFEGSEAPEADRWAQRVSKQLECMTASFTAIPRAFIHFTDEQHSSWDFKLFATGQHLGGIETVLPPVPVLLGDVGAWCQALGVEREVPDAYLSALRQYARTREPETFAFPDDAEPAWKGPAHLWFASRIGITHPFSEKALPLGARFKPFSTDPPFAPFGDLPNHLPWAQWLPDDVDEYLPAETLRQQRLVLGFAEDVARDNPSAALKLSAKASHPSLTHKVRLVSLRAEIARDGFRPHKAAVLAFATAWLQPPVIGGLNQSVDRAALLGLLEGRDEVDVKALAEQIRAAGEPDQLLR